MAAVWRAGVLVTAGAVGLSAALTASQVPAPSQPSTTFRTGVDVVRVDVSALARGDFADNRSADCTIELPLDMLEAGEYLLTVEASERTRTDRRDLRFSVR